MERLKWWEGSPVAFPPLHAYCLALTRDTSFDAQFIVVLVLPIRALGHRQITPGLCRRRPFPLLGRCLPHAPWWCSQTLSASGFLPARSAHRPFALTRPSASPPHPPQRGGWVLCFPPPPPKPAPTPRPPCPLSFFLFEVSPLPHFSFHPPRAQPGAAALASVSCFHASCFFPPRSSSRRSPAACKLE